jgi:hypothetical protein
MALLPYTGSPRGRAHLVVDLHVADKRGVVHARFRFECLKNVRQRARDDAAVLIALRAARDRERLAAAGLTVLRAATVGG